MDEFTMRSPCPKCQHTEGVVIRVGLQDTVRCRRCQRFCYNAPRTETGEKTRTVSTVHALITGAMRARILERANTRCELCGRAPDESGLHVGHIISVSRGLPEGLTERELNHPDNLVALCAECNLGIGDSTMPLPFALKVFKTRTNGGRHAV